MVLFHATLQQIKMLSWDLLIKLYYCDQKRVTWSEAVRLLGNTTRAKTAFAEAIKQECVVCVVLENDASYKIDKKKVAGMIRDTPEFLALYTFMYDTVDGIWDDPIPTRTIKEFREKVKNGSW